MIAFGFALLCLLIATNLAGGAIASSAFRVMSSPEPDKQAAVGAVAFLVLAVFFVGAGVQSLFC